jgi:hypothetical protein
MITDGDLSRLKSLAETSIWFLMTEKENYSLDDSDSSSNTDLSQRTASSKRKQREKSKSTI